MSSYQRERVRLLSGRDQIYMDLAVTAAHASWATSWSILSINLSMLSTPCLNGEAGRVVAYIYPLEGNFASMHFPKRDFCGAAKTSS